MVATFLRSLLSRARGGDREAGAALHGAIEPQLTFIVRQALRDPDNNPFGARVMEEAREVAADCPPGQATPEYMMGQIVRRLSSSLRGQLVPTAPASRWQLDTVVNSPTW